MGSGFLDALGDALLDQFNISENTPSDLDQSGRSFGALGKFASEIDRSANRSYVEDGKIRNVRPRAMEVIAQEPDITVLVKKRIFSSLIENYRTDLMDENDKLFLRATKKLFYNKCRLIAAYEQLTKIERIASKDAGIVNDFLLPQIFTAIDIFDSNPITSELISGKTKNILETIRKVKALSDPNYITTWVDDKTIPYVTDKGEGTGVIDLTLVQSCNWRNSVKWKGGEASLTILDPYKMMIITEDDIEQAISDASSVFKASNFFQLTEFQLQQSIEDLKERLTEIRRSRGMPPIRFIISENTLLHKKVRAIYDEIGEEIIFSFNAGSFGVNLFSLENSTIEIDPQSLSKEYSLQDNEIGLFKQIAHNIYLWLAQKFNTKSRITDFNKEMNYIRKKMILHYHGKSIIQPMDVINIFVSSKTFKDSKLTTGLNYSYTGDKLVGKLNSTIGSVESALDDLVDSFSGGGNQESYVENEKNAIVGPEFPTWLWYMMRNEFTRQAAGTCVFSGIVDRSTHSYNVGKYTLNIGAKDNSFYFDMGQVNFQPSVSVYNGNLYDPLTPFKETYDISSGILRGEVPELLPENIRVLNSDCIKSKLGRKRGKAETEDNYLNAKEVEKIPSGLFGGRFVQGTRRIFTDPEGFVYRWKEGIGSLVLFGDPHADGSAFQTEASPNLTKSPFAGQDVMNVLSLLITGQPYDFNTFLRGALRQGKLTKEDAQGSTSVSFFRGLLTQLSETNSTWGNFIPFKKLIINERGYNFLASGEFDLISRNETLSSLLQERAKLFDQLTTLVPDLKNTPQFINSDKTFDNRGNINLVFQLGDKLIELDSRIAREKEDFVKTQNQLDTNKNAIGSIKIFGNDISFDPEADSTGQASESKRNRERSEFRKKINYMTQRRVWKVRSNEDQNLLIVDDAYDKNYDIQAFEQSLIELKLFESTYMNVSEQVNLVANLLGLEVFADSQGHIHIRPPQYNRIPSSVYYDLLQKRAQKGIQIFPKYLESLFFNKIQSLSTQIEIVEDQIRLRAAVLGAATDTEVESKIGSNFRLVTTIGGFLGGTDIRNLLMQAEPDFSSQTLSESLNSLSTDLNSAINNKVNFDITRQIQVVNDTQTFNIQSTSRSVIEARISEIADRLSGKMNQKIPQEEYSSLALNSSSRNQSNILRISNEIADLISERQMLIKSLSNATQNLKEGVAVNSTTSGVAEGILSPNIYKSDESIFPAILEHMIEDETNDDYGTNSGKRFVIQDSQIYNISITETPPEHTIVQVDGSLEVGLVEGPSGLNLGGGANGISTAFAVDYDMWRMYGFKAPYSISAPYFSNPYTQCAPYAVYLLNLARKNIFRTNISLIGNEFIQAGEVYYIEDRDLLVYADSVSGEYTYGSSFRTTIDGTFAHSPGEYIPTQLDIIGKGLYANRYIANLVRHERFGSAENESHIGVVIHDTLSSSVVSAGNDALEAIVKNPFGDDNKKSLTNLGWMISGYLNANRGGKEQEITNIEIRIYYNTASTVNFPTANSSLRNIANAIKSWLLNPSSISVDGESVVADPNLGGLSAEDIRKRVSIVEIDLNPMKANEIRGPSRAAWDKSRLLASRGFNIDITDTQSNEVNSDKLLKKEREALFNSVIDIWAKFVGYEETLEQQEEKVSDNQAAQAERKKIEENKEKFHLLFRNVNIEFE